MSALPSHIFIYDCYIFLLVTAFEVLMFFKQPIKYSGVSIVTQFNSYLFWTFFGNTFQPPRTLQALFYLILIIPFELGPCFTEFSFSMYPQSQGCLGKQTPLHRSLANKLATQKISHDLIIPSYLILTSPISIFGSQFLANEQMW